MRASLPFSPAVNPAQQIAAENKKIPTNAQFSPQGGNSTFKKISEPVQAPSFDAGASQVSQGGWLREKPLRVPPVGFQSARRSGPPLPLANAEHQKDASQSSAGQRSARLFSPCSRSMLLYAFSQSFHRYAQNMAAPQSWEPFFFLRETENWPSVGGEEPDRLARLSNCDRIFTIFQT